MDSMSMFSMAGSAFSTLATGYFWLVRNRREKPNLRAYLADREFYLGRGGADNRQIGVIAAELLPVADRRDDAVFL